MHSIDKYSQIGFAELKVPKFLRQTKTKIHRIH